MGRPRLPLCAHHAMPCRQRFLARQDVYYGQLVSLLSTAWCLRLAFTTYQAGVTNCWLAAEEAVAALSGTALYVLLPLVARAHGMQAYMR